MRAFFAVPRSAEDPRARDLLQLPRRVEMVEGYGAWAKLGEGIAGFRMGEYDEARTALVEALRDRNPKLQASAQAFLAMTCHRLGEEEKAREHLERGQSALGKLEAGDVSAFWHDRVLGRLACEEAQALLDG